MLPNLWFFLREQDNFLFHRKVEFYSLVFNRNAREAVFDKKHGDRAQELYPLLVTKE